MSQATAIWQVTLGVDSTHALSRDHDDLAPAFLHFVVQGAVTSVHITGDSSAAFPLVWIAASAVIPALALFVPLPAEPNNEM